MKNALNTPPREQQKNKRGGVFRTNSTVLFCDIKNIPTKTAITKQDFVLEKFENFCLNKNRFTVVILFSLTFYI